MALPAGYAAMGSFRGKKGDRGDKGYTGSLAFATYETIPADQPGSVVMVGSEDNRGAHFRSPRGLPGLNAVPTDQAFATLIGADETESAKALRKSKAVADVSHQGYLPLTGVTITTATVRPVGSIDDVMYGIVGNTMRQSLDGGLSWTDVRSVLGFPKIVGVKDTGDGEVMLVTESQLYKSTGWATPEAATFAAKRASSSGSRFAPFNVSVDPVTGRILATEYDATYVNSRYVYFSADRGATFSIVYDLNAHATVPANSHLHVAAVDPWANGRLWISWHDFGSSERGVFYSDDNGVTWTVLPGTWGVHQPTVGIPTDAGMVWGTDDNRGGIYATPRVDDPAQMTYNRVWEWRGNTALLLGFAHDGWRDPETGTVYLAYVAYNYARPIIAASDGVTGSLVWEDTSIASHDVRGVQHIVGAAGRISAGMIQGNPIVESTLSAPFAKRGVADPRRWDEGRVGGGKVTSDTGVAVGADSAASGLRSVAVGISSKAAGSDTVSIGHGASVNASSSVAVGAQAVAADLATAVGRQANAGTQVVAVGQGAAGFANTVALGMGAGGRSSDVAIGHQAMVNGGAGSTVGGNGVAVGKSAVAGNQGVALGQGAVSSHDGSVALGRTTATTAVAQVHFGSRHLALGSLAAAPGAPAAGGIFYIRLNGSKNEFWVRFPTGAAKLISTED